MITFPRKQDQLVSIMLMKKPDSCDFQRLWISAPSTGNSVTKNFVGSSNSCLNPADQIRSMRARLRLNGSTVVTSSRLIGLSRTSTRTMASVFSDCLVSPEWVSSRCGCPADEIDLALDIPQVCAHHDRHVCSCSSAGSWIHPSKSWMQPGTCQMLVCHLRQFLSICI